MPVMFSDVLPTLVSVAVWGDPFERSMTFGTSFRVLSVSVTAALAVLVVFVTEVEAIVTAELASTLEGAVQVVGLPLAVVEGTVVPQPGEHAVPLCVIERLQAAC
jgi:hypothetical protein